MQNRKIVYSFLTILVLIYNFVFWGEKLGLNLMLFLIAASSALLIVNKNNINKRNILLSLFSLVLSIIFMIFNNSVFSKTSSVISFILFTGFVHQRNLRTVFSSFFTAASSLILFPYNIIEEIKTAKDNWRAFAVLYRISKIVILPLIVFVLFYALYANANPLFNTYSVSFWETLNDYLNGIFEIYPIERIFFLILGLILISGILINRNINVFAQIDNMFLDNLFRDKKFKVYGRINLKTGQPGALKFNVLKTRMNSLKTEMYTGVVLLALVNVLLLMVNVLDISFTWFGFNPKEVENLAYYVHHGTYLLIFSITLSMFILLYIFRSNQNFYSKSTVLKFLAYLWILQNGVMAISVFIRNYYYIQYYYALSYKRIGVIIFLILVSAGLITMFFKIYFKKTTFYLFKINSIIAFIMLLIMSSYSWDPLIAEFNLSNPDKDKIDIGFLLSLSDDTLPVLDRCKDKIDRDFNCYRMKYNGLEILEKKKEKYFNEQQKLSWLSWNYSDYTVIRYFKNKTEILK